MILFIIPVRDEPGIVLTVASLVRWAEENYRGFFEILCIDDHSKHEFFLSGDKVKVVKNNFDSGKGSALKTGLILSEYMYRLNDDDLIAFMDGDGQITPDEVKTFLNLMEIYNADVVIGNKRHKYSAIKYGRLRSFISKGFNWLARKLFDLNFEDTQCGLKIFKKRCLQQIIPLVNIKRYAFDLELLVALKENHFRIIDAPVNIRAQLNQGSVSFGSVVQTFLDTLVIWYKKSKGLYV